MEIKRSESTNFKRAVGILSKTDKIKLMVITLIQVLLGVLDLFGVLAVGLLGTLSVSGIQSQEPGTRVNSVLSFLRLSESSFQTQATAIGLAAVLLLVGRTVLSIIFTRRILYFMSRRGALISANLVRRFLSQPLLVVQKWSTQESLFAVTIGVEIFTISAIKPSCSDN